MKPIRFYLTVSLFALSLPAAAFAEMGACESAIRARTPADDIRLYTICMDGLPEVAMAGAHHNRGIAYLANGDLDAAEADLNASLSFDNKYGLAYFNRAVIHAHHGDIALALDDLNQALDLRPSRIHSAARLRRAGLLQITGDYAGAIADYDTVIARRLAFMDPDRRLKLHQRAEARLGKALLLASSADASVRDGAQAVILAQEALAHEDSAHGRAVLAAAFAEAGRFEDAVREQQLAMQMAAQQGAAADPQMETRMAAYQAGQAHHQAPSICVELESVACGTAWAMNEEMILHRGRIDAHDVSGFTGSSATPGLPN